MTALNECSASAQPPPALAPDVDSFFWPTGFSRFVQEHWQRQSWMCADVNGSERLRHLNSDIGSLDVFALLKHSVGPVNMWFTNTRGSFETLKVGPQEAESLYRAGMTAYFHVGAHMPALARWVDEIGAAFGIPHGAGYCSLIAGPGRSHTPFHFDPNDNFTVQVRGEKRWQIWKNDQVAYPTRGYVAGRDPHEELRLYCDDLTFKAAGPPEMDVVLECGSLLYVPRGHWHCVDASTESLALNMAFPGYTWVDFVLPLIRENLLKDPVWRQSAYPASASSDAHRARAAEMLCRLARDVQNLSV